MLPADWASFSFDYRIDMRALVPHLLALEAYGTAAATRVLPAHWLDAPDSAETMPRTTDAARAWVAHRFVPGSAPLALADLLTLHRLAAEQTGIEAGEPGALRRIGVQVGKPEIGLHRGAPPERLLALLEDYVRFIEGDALAALPAVIHALLAHFFLDTIHPFLDANGRTARLAAAAVLARRGGNLHGSYALARHFYRHGRRYHTILHHSWQTCPFELTPFVAFGIEGVVMELRSVDVFLKMKRNRIADPAVVSAIPRRGLRGRRTALAIALLCHLLQPSIGNAAEPPGLTAALAPPAFTVGVTKTAIIGNTRAGDEIIDISAFPDGSVHRLSARAGEDGAYAIGPFVPRQLGTYHDRLKDETTGAATEISYSGSGDFDIAASPAEQTIVAGQQARFTVTVKSIGGLAGAVAPAVRDLKKVQGAFGSWSIPSVELAADGIASSTYTVMTLLSTPIGSYDLVFEGAEGAETRRAAPVRLVVTGPPPDAITASFQPATPIVGVTESTITGKASPGEWVIDTSTFPDGTVHTFTFKATGRGLYTDGPFVLRQLGTYHDVLKDTESGGQTAIDYQGAGDFEIAVNTTTRTVAPGQTAEFNVTFRSLAGFVGTVRAAIANAAALPSLAAQWSTPAATVAPGAPATLRLSVKTPADIPASTLKIAVQGSNGAVTHAAPDIELTVAPR
jgi:hypothetical protein